MPYRYAFSVVVVAAMVAFLLWPRPTRGPRATPAFALGTIGSEAPFLLSLYLVAPLRIPDPRVRRTRDVAYGQGGSANWLDVYRRRGVRSAPAFLYFHPSGFQSGSKDGQSKLLLETLAMNGWVCASANYRLKTAYGNSLVDAKRAIAWMKAQGPECGGVGVRGGGAVTSLSLD